MPTAKPYGWEVEVEFQRASGKPHATFHWRGCSERQAYRKGMMQTNAERVVEIRPVTQEQWERAYGIAQRMVVAFGGGVNSTAMLVEMHKRGIIPDLILFADTGGERPETYRTVWLVSEWCKLHGLPKIVTVTEPGATLEEDCLTRKALPAIAYGFKSCSDRWKQRPQKRYLKTWLKPGEKYRQAVGFDAGEWVRMRDSDDPNCTNWYPLVDWKIHREECKAICVQAGLPTAKSSCFFCPSMRKPEVLELAAKHPELLARAVAMEQNADLTSVKGLGRHWSWEFLVKSDADQMRLFSDAGTPEIACGCYDG